MEQLICMISAAIKKKILLFRKQGFSHRKISKKLKIGLGNAFFYPKTVVLNKIQRQKLKAQTALGAPLTLRQKWGRKGEKLTKYRTKYTKKDLVEMVHRFRKTNSRIPIKREFNNHWQSIRRIFGSWNSLVEKAGYEKNLVLFSKKYVANDGHKCDSLSEKIIDDWFYARKLNYEINFPYPGNFRFTVDFKVNEYWIEFFGLSGELKSYDRLKTKKLKIAKQNNLNLVELYPKDLFPKSKLDNILSFLLK